MRTLRITGVVLICLAALTAVALAHTPIFLTPGRAHPPIRNPAQSWAIYGRLPPGKTADLIPMEAQSGQPFRLKLLVPQGQGAFCPRTVLMGPDLQGEPPPSTGLRSGLPGDMPPYPGRPSEPPLTPGPYHGAYTLLEPAGPPEFYEQFTQIRYNVCGEASYSFPTDGRYQLVIYDPAREGGTYTAALGQEERFGLADALLFPLTWARVHVWLWR